MSWEAEQLRLNVTAAADLSGSQYKIVDVAGTISASVALGSKTAIGVLLNKPQSGEQAEVAYLGRMKGYAGLALAAGARLQVTSGGFLTTVQSGNVAVGKALAAANSGDLVPFVGNFIGNYTAITSGG